MKQQPEITLLVDSKEFWPRLEQDIVESKHHIYLQTFSLEGDSIGKRLCELLLEQHTADIKVMVDSFSKFVINDKFIYSPPNLLDMVLRQEIHDTLSLMDRLRRGGVDVKYTNPVGILFSRILERNHKKLILIDGRIAYIGGINFCTHNFLWHDLMLRIEHNEIAEMLEWDFIETWNGRSTHSSVQFEGIEIHTLDGWLNKSSFNTVLQLIDKANNHIFVESPYLTFPVVDALARARSRGVLVTIVAPETNNRGLIKEYIIEESKKNDFKLMFYRGGMTHLKAILIDDDFLVVGSSNFDFISFSLHQELLAIITARNVILDFKEKVMIEDIERSRLHREETNGFGLFVMNFILRLFLVVVVKVSSAIRTSRAVNRHSHGYGQSTRI